jgi:hypothetical protein
MADTGARTSKKLEEEQVETELEKVGRTSEEIALEHQLPEDSNLSTEERRLAAKSEKQAVDSELEAGEDQGDELRHTDEQIVQQTLNQGMDTGTHDSTRHGVDWGKSYQARPTKVSKPQKKG